MGGGPTEHGAAAAAPLRAEPGQHHIAPLRELYEEGSAFPSWIRDDHQQCPLAKYKWSHTTAYYPSGTGVPEREVQEMLTQREPVNVQMERYFDQDGMEKLFGWRCSYYFRMYGKEGQRSGHEGPLPNVAVYCCSPLCTAEPPSAGKADEKTRDYVPDKEVHLINVIAPAFDSTKQPDWQHFFPHPQDSMVEPITETRHAELMMVYRRIFKMIFTCAKEKKLGRVVIPLFGCGNFAQLYRSRNFTPGASSEAGGRILFPTVFLPALDQEIGQLRKGDVREISVFGTASDQKQLDQIIALVNEKYSGPLGLDPSKMYGPFPKTIDSQEELDRTLLVNAWDPHSIAGNGHKHDFSLDGFIGRYTAISVLCWPMTNPSIKYVPVSDE